jgi:hypothetical protein
MRSQVNSRDTRSLARFQQAMGLRLTARRCALGLSLAAILCGLIQSPSRAAAQEPGTSPEINAPNSESEHPVNNTSARPSNERRGMPTNVVDPQPARTADAPTPSSTALPNTTAPKGAAATTPAPQVEATSLLQQPAHRAEVHVGDSGLTVQADNSNLSQVLHDISSATGMKVEGLGHDERIFGNYGPGAPRDVLASLLYGAGYNVLMVGEIADGAPRQLILSQRNGRSAPAATAEPANTDEEDVEPDPGEAREDEAPPPPEAVPVLQRPDATPGSEVRTPQQLLEQLQRMHQDQPQQPPPQTQQQQ